MTILVNFYGRSDDDYCDRFFSAYLIDFSVVDSVRSLLVELIFLQLIFDRFLIPI